MSSGATGRRGRPECAQGHGDQKRQTAPATAARSKASTRGGHVLCCGILFYEYFNYISERIVKRQATKLIAIFNEGGAQCHK